MDKYIISVGTITHALKGRDILKKNGLEARVERRTRDIGKYGCGYAIIVTADDIEKIKNLLNNSSVRILNIQKSAVL